MFILSLSFNWIVMLTLFKKIKLPGILNETFSTSGSTSAFWNPGWGPFPVVAQKGERDMLSIDGINPTSTIILSFKTDKVNT